VSGGAGETDRPEPEPSGQRDPDAGGRPGAESDGAERGPGDAGAEPGENPGQDGREYVCEICGSLMLERHCKILCPVCGYQRDCSDP